MKSVPLWCPQYSNVLIFSCPLPLVYFQWVPLVPTSRLPWYYPVGQCSTRKYLGTRGVPGYLISYPIGYPCYPVRPYSCQKSFMLINASQPFYKLN